MKPLLSTIGYQGANPLDFWATIRTSQIRTLIDIRDVPQSRRPGFSMRTLKERASFYGITYVHLRGLGDPKDGREAARSGDYGRFREIFTRHMELDVAQADIAKASQYALASHSCLLCFERHPAYCHRSIVAAYMNKRDLFQIQHLGVRDGLGRTLLAERDGQPTRNLGCC